MVESAFCDGKDALVSEGPSGDIDDSMSSNASKSSPTDTTGYSGRPEFSTADWPQLSESAVKELVVILTFLEDEAQKDPSKVAEAISKCKTPLPWFEIQDPGPLLRAMEGSTERELLHLPPLYCTQEAVSKCLKARRTIEELVPGVVFEGANSSAPEISGTVGSVKSGARGVSVRGKLSGPLVCRGVVVGEATVQLPKEGSFCFANSNGSSVIRESAGSEPCDRCSLSTSRAADIIHKLASG